MRRRQLLAFRCERARALGSARLDGPLSEFDRAYLDRHLEGCPDCSHALAEMARLTDRVRAEPLHRAPRWAGAVVAAPRRRSSRRLGVFAGVTAAAAAAAVMGALVASPWHRPAPANQAPPPIHIAQLTTPHPWPFPAGPKHRPGPPH
jgi:anti-sigma factor RsiW